MQLLLNDRLWLAACHGMTPQTRRRMARLALQRRPLRLARRVVSAGVQFGSRLPHGAVSCSNMSMRSSRKDLL